MRNKIIIATVAWLGLGVGAANTEGTVSVVLGIGAVGAFLAGVYFSFQAFNDS